MKKLKQNVLEDQGSNTQSLTLGREYSDLPDHLLIDIFFRLDFIAYRSSILRRQDFTELFLTKSLTLPRLLFAFEVGGKLFVTSSLQIPNWDNTSVEIEP
ncbi:hypothetical protein HID58_070661 [Brassica napus]|uniref:F-box domain-containing protein n=1 Tax=Brassica napus TaxID=3708 RepID=A0ABQ7YZE0_BRANA|nr:hypothetical protein HID58_070661 [Brassica napus]